MKQKKTIFLRALTAALVMPMIFGCVSQQIVKARALRRRAPAVEKLSPSFTTSDELRHYLQTQETANGWRFFVGREQTEYSYKFKNLFSWKKIRNRMPAPNLIGFQFFDHDLRFYLPGMDKSTGGYVAGVSAFSFTPNGDRLVFSYLEGKTGPETPIISLYLWDVSDKAPQFIRRLPGNSPPGNRTPLALSADGLRVAMIMKDEKGGTQIVVMNLSDRKERVVTTGAYGDLNWADGGKSIIFQPFYNWEVSMKPQIISVNVETSSRTVVTNGFAPVVSPDGRKMAFIREYHKGLFRLFLGPKIPMYDVVVRNLETGKEEPIVIHNRLSWSSGMLGGGHRLAWSPDGRFLHYLWLNFQQIPSGFIIDTESHVAVNLGQKVAFDGWNRLSEKFEAQFTRDETNRESANDLWKNLEEKHREQEPARPESRSQKK